MKEGEAMESPNEREQGEREKTDREKTGTLLSLGVNKRDLSSQSFAVYTEAIGDPCCICVCNSLTTLRAPSLSPSHTHPTLSLGLYSVWVYMHVYVARLGHLSIEKDRSFHGAWGELVSMSRPEAKL